MLNFKKIINIFLGNKNSYKQEVKKKYKYRKNTFVFRLKKESESKKKQSSKQLNPGGLSDLEFKLLMKKPLYRSPLDNAIYAAKQIHYNSRENKLNVEDRKIQKQTKFEGQEINVYVNADLSFSPNNLTNMFDLCTELNNR